MLLVGKRRLTAAALRNFSVSATKNTLADVTEQSKHGVIELPPQAPLPVLDPWILRQVATDVLGAYDTYGPIDIAHSWVLGAGLQETAAMARG